MDRDELAMRGRDQDWTSNKAVDSRPNTRKSSFAGELTKNATHPLGTSFRSFGAFQMILKINLILLCSRGCFVFEWFEEVQRKELGEGGVG